MFDSIRQGFNFYHYCFIIIIVCLFILFCCVYNCLNDLYVMKYVCFLLCMFLIVEYVCNLIFLYVN